MTPLGLPHSEIPGSKPVCGSPRLIAAYHVLHRLPAPRHPPCALHSLTNSFAARRCRPGQTARVTVEPPLPGIFCLSNSFFHLRFHIGSFVDPKCQTGYTVILVGRPRNALVERRVLDQISSADSTGCCPNPPFTLRQAQSERHMLLLPSFSVHAEPLEAWRGSGRRIINSKFSP